METVGQNSVEINTLGAHDSTNLVLVEPFVQIAISIAEPVWR
jgi:hypothetical protein